MIVDFINKATTQTAKDLLGVKIIYQDDNQYYSGYIVETEAYLGFNDRAAHGYGGKQTPKVTSLYKTGGTIYAHVMHTHLLINFVTRTQGVPEGVLIRAIEPEDGIEAMKMNRGKTGYEITNGPGKWTKALNIPRAIDGSTLNDCRLSIDIKNRKYPKEIVESGRIGIPNKGEWTHKPLRYTVKGNPYVSRMRKSDFQNPDDTWK
ncbi:DNA-3-methyladenine glycosylase [Staphylococcus caprae M23864:W1]|uniref:Putative 3-methyladenine DNA glycosylase n=3 Tax=Staphylococcus TaxID=1279 RepID=A0ABM7FNU5_9STAP|nr:DNA-3-methyladenine glycosylase [Staphylococcus caprae]EES41904.1 DNA-3-methyladenine glycosylase [Staphylococcus caprae M23864:W1]BBD89264.1 putative DNA-3-methyladenine glycosidase [Staphylococcus caprae]BBD91739.1 putative DNA-3-methyladenine glycosidase [Staphylococcus caprae]